ncbi:hypothetical protein [Legionella sp. 16cNR16C]|uniref:hypothetical protein n=1 Tax=Legionella sp. 16cNR16C TaxID=2905656 RepID=UPI001E2B2CFC|nr:hypothetical protein [Legionella sp. 16cNR16C]MCE3043465.1 hypothetical protein [Legionella sp. 16cNR16C]
MEERTRREAEQRQEQERARQEAEAQERARQEKEAERRQQAERARLAVERRQAEENARLEAERARELEAQQEREAESEAQVVTIHPLMNSDEEQHKEQPIDSGKPSSALDLLIKAAKTYHDDRKGKGKTLHRISWGQYTEEDKLGAANHFIDAICNKDGFITAKDRGALKNGRLYTTLNKVFEDNRQAISRELNQDLQSFDDLLNTLNKREPIETLKRILNTYKADRATKPDYYHRTFFSQYSGPQKIASVKNFLETITRGDNLSPDDLAIIKQGSLGRSLKEFIKESGGALSEFLQTKKPINTIDDLVSAFYPPPQQENVL